VHQSVVEGLSPTLTERILAGALDLAVVYNPAKDSRLACEPLLEEELYLVGREDIIGRASTPVTFAEIAQGSVLGLYPAPASRSIIAAQILRNQITPSPTLEIDSLNAMRKALEAGLGCAVLARSTVASELSEGRIHARRIVQPAVTRTLNVVALAEHPKTRAFAEIKRIIAGIILDEVKDGNWPAKPSSRKKKS